MSKLMRPRDYDSLLRHTCELVAESTGYSGQVTAETTFRADLNLDSLRLMELMCQCEEYFDAELPLERLAAVRTVGDIVSLLHSLPSPEARP